MYYIEILSVMLCHTDMSFTKFTTHNPFSARRVLNRDIALSNTMQELIHCQLSSPPVIHTDIVASS